jgi:hypothetical protein
MHPSKLKKKLIKRHKDWINIVKSFGLKDYAEDLVQEMYIRVIKYIDDGKGDINYIYVYQCLRHMTLNLQIKKAKINVINIDDYLYKTPPLDNLDQDIEKTYKKINKKLDDMFWYDAKVYRIIEGGMSIKELSRQSKISYYSLYRTYNKVKDILKDEIR